MGERRERRNDERRQSKRLTRHFVVAYRIYGAEAEYDLSQIKNISKGGLCFITSKKYPLETVLSIELKTPVSSGRIKLLGKVVESTTVVDDLIYDTRVTYTNLDEETESLIDKTIQHFSDLHGKRSFWEEWNK